jgi:hypothetical protein
MHQRLATLFVCFNAILPLMNYAQSKPPVNYLHTPASLTFSNSRYNFAWSSHPSATYYKQEYIKPGETVDNFSTMLMLELLNTNVHLRDVVNGKVAELKQMKTHNPYVNYETIYNKDKNEYILDFLVTANSADGKEIRIAERNVYRYCVFKNKKGEPGVQLIAISSRSYGSDVPGFMQSLKNGRAALVAKVVAFTIPAIDVN